MVSVPPAPHTPVVALAVEPRLLRETLALVLGAEGVSVVDTEDLPEHCDVLVTSQPDVPAGVADLVIFIDPEDASAGIRSVSDLIELIRRWSPGGDGAEPVS